ncbi:hypothetical protein HAX54_031170, partial [Datura stramonium]|nr:hypothetical protein [Datura stramonium]
SAMHWLIHGRGIHGVWLNLKKVKKEMQALNRKSFAEGREPWNTNAKQASLIVQKIMKARKYLEEAGLNMEEILREGSYSIKGIYTQLRGTFSKLLFLKKYFAATPPMVGYTSKHIGMDNRDELGNN